MLSDYTRFIDHEIQLKFYLKLISKEIQSKFCSETVQYICIYIYQKMDKCVYFAYKTIKIREFKKIE